MSETTCYYPDWEGGLEKGKHSYDKDGFCNICGHKKECENEYGKENENGDDYRAVAGTHFCRKSWDSFPKHQNIKKGTKDE